MTPDLHPVAAAYREVRRTGALDLPAYRAALAVYRQAHPLADHREADEAVRRIVASAAHDTPEIMWDGVGDHPVRRWWETTAPRQG